MAFNTAPGRAEYTATAGQTIFSFVFKIYQTSDINVYLTPSGQDGDDANDLLALTTDYTVVINGDNGGAVTLLVAASLGDKITIERDLPIDRATEYQQNGDLTAATLNLDQNYQTYLVADSEAKKDRSLQLPSTAQNVNNIIPTPAANHYLKWDADAQNFVNDPLTELNPTDRTKILHIQGGGAGNPEGYTSAEIDASVAERRKLYAKESTTHDMASDADYPLTSDQNLYGRIVITDTGTVLTTARNIVIDVSIREFIAKNDTAQTLTFKTNAGTGISVAAGKAVVLYCDGTNVVNPTNQIKVDSIDNASGDVDILTVEAGLKNNNRKILSTTNFGYQVRSGSVVTTTNASGDASINYGTSFPTATRAVVAVNGDASTGSLNININLPIGVTSGFNFRATIAATGAAYVGSIRIDYIAMGD